MKKNEYLVNSAHSKFSKNKELCPHIYSWTQANA